MISVETAITIIAVVVLAAETYLAWRGQRVLALRLDAVLRDRDKYLEIAERSMTYLDALRTRLRVQDDEPDFKYVPRSQPVRHSDPTRIAEDHADAQTLESRLSAIISDIDRLTEDHE